MKEEVFSYEVEQVFREHPSVHHFSVSVASMDEFKTLIIRGYDSMLFPRLFPTEIIFYRNKQYFPRKGSRFWFDHSDVLYFSDVSLLSKYAPKEEPPKCSKVLSSLRNIRTILKDLEKGDL